MLTPPWLSTDDARFICQGLSITLASRDLRHVPSIARGLASKISDDGEQLIVLVRRSQSESLLADVERSGHIAVVITEPSTHRTLQFKGRNAVVVDCEAGDLALVDASRCHFGADILPLGFSETFTRLLFDCDPGDLCRVRFTPRDIYQQTPGPDAGRRIGPDPEPGLETSQ